MSEQSPTISIIVVCLNSEKYIRDALESIRAQTVKPHELIVIDGASTDTTNDIVKEYQDVLTHHVSEPDRGIANAMNKGLTAATGDFVFFLGADDFLASDDVIEKVSSTLDSSIDVHGFDIIFRRDKGDVRIPPRRFGFLTNFKIPYCHQGVLCKRELFDEYGKFDESLKIDMDYDFLMRLYRGRVTHDYRPVVLSVMRDTGISSRNEWSDLKARFAEERRIHQEHCRSILMKAVYAAYWVAYLSFRRTRKALLGY